MRYIRGCYGLRSQQMKEQLSIFAVIVAGIWLIMLGVAAIGTPERARQFLEGFARSAFAHFLEVFIRIVIGAALVIYAPQMKFAPVFSVFGWLLISTSVILVFVPWRSHRRFADLAVPFATARLPLFGLFSLAGGMFILASAYFGPDAP